MLYLDASLQRLETRLTTKKLYQELTLEMDSEDAFGVEF